jgi:hypothetical protein
MLERRQLASSNSVDNFQYTVCVSYVRFTDRDSTSKRLIGCHDVIYESLKYL